jgi:D-psicose/D-tagatose/L-ribulose 3-epimerase
MEATVTEARYAFPLGIQTILPEDFRVGAFRQRLALLQEFGFTGIELNIVRPEQVEPAELEEFLAGFGLQMTMFASGATANTEGLSLSHKDTSIRLASVQRCVEFIDFAAESGAGVIVGFLKGGPGPDRELATERFGDSLSRLEPHVRARKAPLLIEATNRYESSVANSLQDAADLIQEFQNPYLRILPDTYHMNIEERSTFGALVRYADLYDSLHISDSNRHFPGLGAIDFHGILRFLKDAGYEGGVAIEGNLREGFEEDLRASMSILQPILQQLVTAG